MNRIALHHSPVLPLSPVELVALAREAGYSSIGIRVASADEAEPWWQRGIGSPMLPALVDALLESRVTVLDVGRVELGPELHRVDYAHPYLRALELGARLGAQFVTARATAQPGQREHFAALAELAQRYGLRPLLHAVPGTGAPTLHHALDVVGTSGGGVVLDVLSQAGLTADAVDQTVVELGDRLGYVRLLVGELEQGSPPHGLLATLPPQVPLAIGTDQPGCVGGNRVDRLRAVLHAVDGLLRHPRAATRD
ncbi:sugar phosphate isomerase/epimerase [Pseudonocardia sp. DSM 110487]|uniref:sugar phosphate isomerase/epimerase n=1 Tax=Pseudonocardia sp. DSM 110487 TaxID=2865833 RepID=UPI001C697D90|nr:sugar phosphate isomerase/epimerase [Pseudonocardia sp. DSM 110487]QYN32944.1 sugar phosphate isomerase/epimerase [Pseudonocardia sp. DSM 110487]